MKPYYEHAGITIYHGDCREILPSLKADVVVTDPPYGIPVGAAFVRRGGAVVDAGDGAWNDSDDVYGWLAHVPASVGNLAMFIDRAQACDAERALGAGGFRAWSKFYLVKQAPPATPRPTFVSAVEECVIAERNGARRAWHGTGYEPNYWLGMTPNRLGKGVVPTEKPLAPMASLVRCLSAECDTILDPFMGSGTTLRAAKDLGRKAIGIEIEERYCEIAAKRLAQESMDFGGPYEATVRNSVQHEIGCS